MPPKKTAAPQPPTPEQIDAIVLEYEAALVAQTNATAEVSKLKAELTEQVRLFGSVPANAKSSKRLSGLRKSLMLTFTTSTSVFESGVVVLRDFLAENGLKEIFAKLFELNLPPVYVPPPPKHRRVADLAAVLGGLQQKPPAPVLGKIALLYASAVSVTPNQPTLKIETVKS